MTLFNKREDVEYFEVEVTDEHFNPVAFASENKIYHANYLDRVKVLIFIREESLREVVYICSRSKFIKGQETGSIISSRICSKIR